MRTDTVVTERVREFVEGRATARVVDILAAIAPGREASKGDKQVVGRALRELGWAPRLVRRGEVVERCWLNPRFSAASAPLGRYLIDHPPTSE